MTLAEYLSAPHWLLRRIAAPESLLGDVVTSTARAFLAGATGTGKTQLAMAWAGAMAAGINFLHLKSSRRCRVLYVDGEMSRDLAQERLRDLQRRMPGADLTQLFLLNSEDVHGMAGSFPGVGEALPLNTDAGRAYLLAVVDAVRPDVVVFDNRMSLLIGDMREEQPWADAMPLVRELTERRIAQVWVDHTGHDVGRVYGTKTKEWLFDTVALLTAVERHGADVAVTLAFTKARRRNPSNREDFAATTLTLANDAWSAQPVSGRQQGGSGLSPQATKALKCLVRTAVSCGPFPTTASQPMAATTGAPVEDWWRECERAGLSSSPHEKSRRDIFERSARRLVNAGLVATSEGRAWLVSRHSGEQS